MPTAYGQACRVGPGFYLHNRQVGQDPNLMSTQFRACFGVTIPFESKRLEETLDDLAGHVERAIADTRRILKRDKGGAHQFSANSVLHDCGLPGTDGFSDFADALLSQEIDPKTIPLIGLTQDTLNHLWRPPELQAFSRLRDYYWQLHYLGRLNKNDKIWQHENQQKWFATYGSQLTTYMVDLFSNRFLDRNGTRIAFDLKNTVADLMSLDQKLDAPQLAGALVSVLVEFLGDTLFQVPFYSADISAAYRSYAENCNKSNTLLADLHALSSAIQTGTLAAASAPLIGFPSTADVQVPWAVVSQAETPTSLVQDYKTRMVLTKISDLDGQYLGALTSLSNASQTLDDIEAEKSDLEKQFTCFRAQVIKDYLHCIFISNDPQHQATCGRFPDDTASVDPNKTDYAELVGKLTSAGGTTAEKSVRSIVGALIRGVSIAALQNEVIAEVVGSLAGTLAKKVMERVVYWALIAYIADDSDPRAKRQLLELLAEGVRLLNE